jgi:hypothetical protein
MNEFEFEISNASVDMVEFGWQELIIIKDGEEYILEFETEETPSSGGFTSVSFATDESEKIAQQIGFEITDEFCSELYRAWGNYSNEHFRG